MRYTYEVYDETNKRRNVCTRFEEAKREAEDFNGLIRVTDNANFKVVATLLNQDEMEEWQDKLARDSQWGSRSLAQTEKTPDMVSPGHFDFLKEEDGFHANQFQKFMNEKRLSAHDTIEERKQKLVDNNAKTAAAVGKPKMSGIPPIAIMLMGEAMQDGVNKYGLFNWRDAAVTSTVFYDAILRHLLAWYSGERAASDSGIHHLAHAMAGCAILLDAEYNKCLNDDRKEGEVVTVETFKSFR